MSDILVDLQECEGHPINLMEKYGIRCESLASVPFGECWWIWGAQWSGDLPKGFSQTTIKHHKYYYQYGMFTNGFLGTTIPLRAELNIQNKK